MSPNSAHGRNDDALRTPNASNRYEVSRADLPLHCPMEGMRLWDSHPKVYLPIEQTGKAKCPYCGAEFVLRETARGGGSAAR